MTPPHIARLAAWNEGDDPPETYTHDSLDWQCDLRRALAEHTAMLEALQLVERAPTKMITAVAVRAAIARAGEGS